MGRAGSRWRWLRADAGVLFGELQDEGLGVAHLLLTEEAAEVHGAAGLVDMHHRGRRLHPFDGETGPQEVHPLRLRRRAGVGLVLDPEMVRTDERRRQLQT